MVIRCLKSIDLGAKIPFFIEAIKHQKASIKKNIAAKCCSFVPSVCFLDFETTKTWSTTFDEKHLCRCWLIDKSEWPIEAVENGLNVVARKLKHDSPVGYEFIAYLHGISSSLWYSFMIREWSVWMPILQIKHIICEMKHIEHNTKKV